MKCNNIVLGSQFLSRLSRSLCYHLSRLKPGIFYMNGSSTKNTLSKYRFSFLDQNFLFKFQNFLRQPVKNEFTKETSLIGCHFYFLKNQFYSKRKQFKLSQISLDFLQRNSLGFRQHNQNKNSPNHTKSRKDPKSSSNPKSSDHVIKKFRYQKR